MKTIQLGLVKVQFGIPSDSERLRRLVGDCPCAINLDLDRFPRLGELPKGEVEKELFVVNYGEYFPNNDAVAKRHQEEGLIPQSFFDLIAIGEVPELWEQNVRWIDAGDPCSFWLDSGGSLCVPCFSCNPDYRKLDASWVGDSRRGGDWFLVGK